MDTGFIMLLVVIAVFGSVFLLSKWDKYVGKDKFSTETQEEPPRELDISEPVVSFIKTYEDNPNRFKIINNVKDQGDYHLTLEFKLTDLKNDNVFVILKEARGYCGYRESFYSGCENTQFLTNDEIEFIFNRIQEIADNRKRKIMEYKRNKKRSRYIKDYCKEGI